MKPVSTWWVSYLVSTRTVLVWPPAYAAASKTVTSWPRWRRCAAVSPEMPAPTIAIFTVLHSRFLTAWIKSELRGVRRKAQQEPSGELVRRRSDEHVLRSRVGVAEAARQRTVRLVDGGAAGHAERRARHIGARGGRGRGGQAQR